MISNSGTSTLGLYDLKRQIDAFGGVDYFRPNLAGGYLPNARVMLANGDIVKSTVPNNIIDPNVDMTGWKPSKDKGVITTVESIADLVTIQNPKDGDVVNAKSYYKATNFALLNPFKGGGERVYVESLKTTNNHGTIISGWVATNVSEHTPEMWGAYGDNEHDDTEALNNMFKTLQPYPTSPSVSRSQIANLLNYCKKYTVRALGVYKTSNTVYIPCGITWIQPIDGRWNWSVEIGINYQPQAVNYNKPAVATIAYQYNNDNADLSLGTYTFIEDIFFKPTAADFDGGKFITLGWSVDLQGLTIQTHKDVTLAVFLNGFFGKTNGLSVGAGSHPKVGVVTNLGWNATHDYMFVAASQQAVVFHGVCTYNTLNNPLFNCRNDAVKTTSITPPFKPVDVNTTGTIGITNDQSILNINSLCYQSWTIGVANVNGAILNINNPYFESMLCKYEYYNSASSINGNLCGYFGGYFYDDVINDLDGSAVPFKRSALYVKDMTDNKVKFSGDARFGVWRWIDGINSDNSVHLDLAGFSATWGKLGNIDLLSNLNLFDQKTLHVNSETGDDENFGLSYNKPLKTLRNIFKMGVFGANKTIIYKDITISNVVIDLPDKMDFTAQPADKSIDIILNNGRFVFSKNCNVVFNGFTLSSTAEHGTYCFYATENENTIANLKIFGDVNVNQNLIYSRVNSEIDLTVVGSYVVMPKYLQVADGKHSRFGVTVSYDSAPPNPMTQGNVLLKYKYPPSLQS